MGYGIYVNDKEVGFTTDKNFTYKATTSGNLNITVKSEYQKYKANASSGTSVKASATVTKPEEKGLKISLITSNSEFNIGNYAEAGITASFDGKKVTDECEIEYTFQGKTFKTTSELENEINNLTNPGNYTITYKVSYKEENETTTRKISLKNIH